MGILEYGSRRWTWGLGEGDAHKAHTMGGFGSLHWRSYLDLNLNSGSFNGVWYDSKKSEL